LTKGHQTFYDRRGGWKPHAAYHLVVQVPECLPEVPENTTLLYKDDLRDVCKMDCNNIIEEYKKRELTGFAVATLLPEFKVAEWHFGNEEYIGVIVTGSAPTVKGAKVGTWFIYWIHDFSVNQLVVLRIGRVGSEHTSDDTKKIAALFAAAAAEAQSWNFDTIIAWNPSAEVQAGAESLGWVNTKVEERQNDSIPCMRWQEQKADEVVEWHPNEKYAWC
jgi:hypothetical protein